MEKIEGLGFFLNVDKDINESAVISDILGLAPVIKQGKVTKCIFWFHQGDSEMDFHCSYLHKCPQVLHPIRNKTQTTRQDSRLAIRYLQSISRCVCTHTHRGTSQVIRLVIKYCCFTMNLTNGHRGLDGFVAAAATSQFLLAKRS